MGFKEAKRVFIVSLENKNYRIYRERSNLFENYKLHAKEVDAEFVLEKIRKCRGFNHKSERGCAMADDNCMHVFKIDGWYFKYFLLNEVVHVVSVHEEKSND